MKVKTRIKEFWQRIDKALFHNEILMWLPGNIAFFLVLAIIPTMTLITYGASVLNLSTDLLSEFLTTAFSKDIANIMLSASTIPNAGFTFTVVLIFCYYIASNGADSIIVASNSIYGIKNKDWIRRRFKAIFLTVIFVLIIVFMLIVPLFGRQIIDLINSVNMNPNVSNLLEKIYIWLKSPILWIFLFFIIKIIYLVAPDRKVKNRNANYGAFFTTLSWIVTTWLYSLYINNLANYSALYGSLANVCVLMIWFYFLAYCFVVGLSLSYLKENDDLAKTGIIKK